MLEVLLEKDPSRRFQSPAELLMAMPTITGAMDARRRVTRQSLQKTPPAVSRLGSRKSSTRLGPKKISVAGLPVTGSDVFGREEDIAFLDDVWANQQVNVVTIVAWAGVGKSTLVNHWLRRMATEQYRSAELVFAGPSTDRALVGTLRLQTNLSTPLSLGLVIQIHDSEQHGRKARDWPSSSRIEEPYWF
jgi:hypothetical protein